MIYLPAHYQPVETTSTPALEQIWRELVAALKEAYDEEGLLKLSAEIIAISAKETAVSKYDTGKSVIHSLVQFARKVSDKTVEKYQQYEKEGVKASVARDWESVQQTAKNAPGKIKSFGIKTYDKGVSFNENFIKKTKDEKIEQIAVAIMAILIFSASAGGEDLEGGIPDTDLQVGIGVHRHWMSHSIIAGLVVEFCMRSGLGVFNKIHAHLPGQHHAFWDHSRHYLEKHKNVAIGAMWAGIAAHLIKDSGIIAGGVKPYAGIPVEMPIEAHQGLFAANGAASTVFAWKDVNSIK